MSITRNQASGAYQRWTPPSFDDPVERTPVTPDEPLPENSQTDAEATPAAAEAAEPDEQPAAEPEPEFHLPTAEEIEAIYEQARSEGLAAGEEEGRAAGYAEGLKAAREQVQRLTEVVGAMDTALDALDSEIAEELAGLAIALTREMVGRNLRESPAAVTDIVREALQHLPQGKARILLNPEDIAIVRERLDDALDSGHHKLVEDATVARGGCHIETQGADIDATLHTRWLRVLRGIGREGPEWDAGADDVASADMPPDAIADDATNGSDDTAPDREPPRDA